MNKYVAEVLELYKEKEYDRAIQLGLKYLNAPIARIDKANIYHCIGNAFYDIAKYKEFIHCQKKAIEYAPPDLMQYRLRCLGNAAFATHYISDVTDKELAEIHFQAQEIVKYVPWMYDEEEKQKRALRAKNEPKKKLRIGYISGDFVTSVNLTFAIQLLGAYNKDKYEVYAYGLMDVEDMATEFVKTVVDKWQNISQKDAKESAEIIYNDQIDILFDISLHCGKSRTLSIVAYKPAPIIIGGIGYMSTSGMKAVDYFLTDVYCDPAGMGDEHFTEKLIRLPYSHFCFTPREYSKKFSVNYNIHEDIRFGSLNSYLKLDDDTLKVWKNIMDRVPDSRLILQSSSEIGLKNITKNKMIALGFDMNRVEMRDGSGEYLSTYNDIDIALDSYPYVGGATTFDALYMGVPVVTLYGTRHGTRFGYSIMNNLGLPDLAVNNWKEYEDLAVTLAENKDILKDLHGNLRNMLLESPLMDARLYVHSIEEKYDEIWNNFLQENS